ncbi:uncharacterized protein LOC123357763 isoform X2 [Mauremys mutica]|uniref:uncharacterized protein LOC123357763 isoform X2 n=1 Tax=Mauremys mutica TaxID=74926 RepID=UPI001D139C49|nr:uncharacterized protein LOC123357763 isoform X2 [Mauremys mutica]
MQSSTHCTAASRKANVFRSIRNGMENNTERLYINHGGSLEYPGTTMATTAPHTGYFKSILENWGRNRSKKKYLMREKHPVLKRFYTKCVTEIGAPIVLSVALFCQMLQRPQLRSGPCSARHQRDPRPSYDDGEGSLLLPRLHSELRSARLRRSLPRSTGAEAGVSTVHSDWT